VAPSGRIITTGGPFNDTIPNSAGCDSILTITLTLRTTSTALIDTTLAPGNSIIIAGTPYDSAGTFTDTLTNAAGCDSILTINITLISGRNAPAHALVFQLFPNPTTGELKLKGDFDDSKPLQLTVRDLSGRVVTTRTLQQPRTQLDLPAGAYLVEVRQGEQLGRRKLVVH
jgi:hypothetical protein